MARAYHILMLLSNAYRPDPRVQREASGLVERGYQVTVLCWDRRVEQTPREVDKGVKIIRIQNVATSYGLGWRQFIRIPRFWQACVRFARSADIDAIHCHDLDTLYAGWRIKRHVKCPLVYDAHENYPALMSLYLPNVMKGGLTHWERWLLGKVDTTITASTVLKDEYEANGLYPVIALGNFPRLGEFTATNSEQVSAERERLAGTDRMLTVGYVGGFTRNRLLEPFLAAAELRPDYQFHLWGEGHQRDLVENEAARQVNITYHGWLDFSRIPVVFKALDIIYYGLWKDYPGAIYNAPNTLAQAMAAGRPVIVTDVGDLGRMVKETDCGILLPDNTAIAIAEAIDKLRDTDVREQLGKNGYQAAVTKFNATIMQEQLAAIYKQLLSCS